MFLSYTHSDQERVVVLRDALDARGLRVWFDDRTIDTFESISGAIARGLARSKVLVAFYSREYPTRRACQWELTAAFLAAARLGHPARRVLVVNPESSVEHIEPVQLRDALLIGNTDVDDMAEALVAQVEPLTGELGDLEVLVPPPWFGQRPVGATRFVGRAVDMWKVHSALHGGDVALITGARGDTLAHVTGMGGIGKSLLAEEYALRFAAGYPGGVYWLRAFGYDDAGESLTREGREAQRDRQLARFARGLGLTTRDLSPEELLDALAGALDARARAFLWIVDDLPGELGRRELDGWLAPGRYGKTLLTTRSRGYGSVGNQIDLGVLSEVEGVELLSQHRQPDDAEEYQAARGLVSDLGGHALALDVAGAALSAEEGVRSFGQYRAALANLTEDELELGARFVGQLPNGHEPSIASTLARSIARLDDAGVDFLRLASVLAVQPIPASLVVDVFARADRLESDAARRRAVSAMHAATTLSLAETVGDDEGLRLVHRRDGSRQVHTLVSRTIRLLEQQTERFGALVAAVIETLTAQLQAALSAQLPVAGSTRVAASGAALTHARHVGTPPIDEPRTTLLFWVAEHDRYRGDYRSARLLQAQVLEAMRQLLGDEHPSTLTAMSNLAATLGELGDVEGSRALHEQVVESSRGVWGDKHAFTLTAMSNLAATLRELGELEGPRALEEQVVESSRGVWGAEHPSTLTAMSNLAVTLHESGDLEGARGLYTQVLEAMRRLLGEEHLSTLTAMSNLAATLRESGDLKGARAVYEQVLAARSRVLGEEHPHTLRSLHSLAVTLREAYDLDGARAREEQVVESAGHVLGEEHPFTLTAMSTLAAMVEESGDLEGARALEGRVSRARRRGLTDEHLDMLRSIGQLAATLRGSGDLRAARGLEMQRRVLADEHLSTPGTVKNLVATLKVLERAYDEMRRSK
jgi:tetratricopeptide (TPR) repeat protein